MKPLILISLTEAQKPVVNQMVKTQPIGISRPSYHTIIDHGAEDSYGPHNAPFFIPYSQKGDQVIGREIGVATSKAATHNRTPYSYRPNSGISRPRWTWKNPISGGNMPTAIKILTETCHLADRRPRHGCTARRPCCQGKMDCTCIGTQAQTGVALHRLHSYSECLIIFDNLENSASIKSYLPAPRRPPHPRNKPRRAA